MIYELISSSTHNNNVALYKCISNERIFYKKVAFTKAANRIVENEKLGYDWFDKLLGKNKRTNLKKSYFFEIEIPEFPGNSFPLNAEISGNERSIEKLIDFYKRTWANADDSAIHGDMALCNVIMDCDDNIELVDWEHFHFAGKEYLGFDIFNMFYIALNHQIRSANYINKKTRAFLKESYNELCEAADPSNKILEKPFTRSSRYLRDNQSKFMLNVPLEKKYVLASCLEPELEKLDLIIT
jgi:hypothetical protein